MTDGVFQQWIEVYLRRQEQRDPEVIKELFAEDCIYCWGPFNPPRHGLQATYEHHKNALSHQTDICYEYRILAVAERIGIAHFHLTLSDKFPGEPNRYDGIFVVRLNGQNKCTLFEEWYHSTNQERFTGS